MIDQETGEYFPWSGPPRETWTLAKADADGHNQQPGHKAVVVKVP